MSKTKNICLVFVLTYLVWGTASAQDSATFDAQKNTWKLYYKDPETEQWVHETYAQQNAILPNIKTVIQANRDQLTYRYRINNLRDAKQLVDTFRIWGVPLVYATPNLAPIHRIKKVIETTGPSNTGRNWKQRELSKKALSKPQRAGPQDCA